MEGSFVCFFCSKSILSRPASFLRTAIAPSTIQAFQELRMSSFTKPDHLSPDDPLYYAPRKLRQASDRSSAPVVDEISAENVAASRRHGMHPELVPGPPVSSMQHLFSQTYVRIIAGIAVAIVLSLAGALILVGMLPASRQPNQADGASPSFIGVLQSRGLPDSATLKKSDADKAATLDAESAATPAPGVDKAPVQASSPVDADGLLRQLLEWDKNSDAPRTR